MTKMKSWNWLLLVGIMVLLGHYMLFVTQQNTEKKCLNNLLKAQYDNQNLLTRDFAAIQFDPKYANDPQGQKAALEAEFNAHFARLAKLDKEFTCVS